jgi:hypothetical protein
MLALLHNKTAQSISGWIGIFSAIFAGLVAVTPAWFGDLAWAQAVLLGILLALSGSLAISIICLIAAYAFRHFRPYEVPGYLQNSALATQSAAYDDSEFRSKLDSNSEILAAFAVDAHDVNSRFNKVDRRMSDIIDDYQRMSALEFRFIDELDKLKISIQNEDDSMRMGLKVIGGKGWYRFIADRKGGANTRRW